LVEDPLRSVDSLEHDGLVRRELLGEEVENRERVIVVDVSEVGGRERRVVGRSWDAGRVVEDETGDSSGETSVDGDFLLERKERQRRRVSSKQDRLDKSTGEGRERT